MAEIFEIPRKDNPRLRLFYWLIGCLLLLLLSGIFYRQLIEGFDYSRQEKRQHSRVIVQPGPRGYIYDRNGRLLVGNRPHFSAVVSLNELRPEFRAHYRDLRNIKLKNGEKFDSNALEKRARFDVVKKYQDYTLNIIGRTNTLDTKLLSEEAYDKQSRRIERHFRQELMLPFTLAKDLTLREYSRLIEQVDVQSPVQPYIYRARYYPQGATSAHVLGYSVQGDSLRFAVLIPPDAFKELLYKKGFPKEPSKKSATTAAQKNIDPKESIEAREKAAYLVIKDYLDATNVILDRDLKVNTQLLEKHFVDKSNYPLFLIKDLTDRERKIFLEQFPEALPLKIHLQQHRYMLPGSGKSIALKNPILSEKRIKKDNFITFHIFGSSGRTGIERSFDEQLQGKNGYERWVVDPSGYQYNQTEDDPPVKGKDLYLSLDLNLQRAAEAALDGKIGAVVAVEVQTGEILVLANKPDYDPNIFTPFITQDSYRRLIEARALRNRAIQGLYPPASTFKLITAIAGMKNDIIDDDSVSLCKGSYMVGNRSFKCHNLNGHSGPPVNLEYSLLKSCNVFYYEWGLATGIKHISEEAKRFGLNQPTNISLPHEAAYMIVPDPQWKKQRGLGAWFQGDTVNVAIGHGDLRVTPLQIAAFTASLARRQTRTQLSLIHNPQNNHQRVNHQSEAIGLTDEQYQRLVNGMIAVVSGRGDNGELIGTAQRAYIPGLSIAGKTGTAQYYSDNQKLSLGWFIAFAPAENPQIAIAVVVEGKTLDWENVGNVLPVKVSGGKTAAPIGRAILKEFFLIKNQNLHE